MEKIERRFEFFDYAVRFVLLETNAAQRELYRVPADFVFVFFANRQQIFEQRARGYEIIARDGERGAFFVELAGLTPTSS